MTQHSGYVRVYRPDHHRADANGYINRSWLVAEAKIGRLLRPGEVVHHINQIRSDDRPENLEVIESQSVHVAGHNRGSRRGRLLTERQVAEIKALLADRRDRRPSDRSALSLAKRFGVSYSTIAFIKMGKTWRWVQPAESHS